MLLDDADPADRHVGVDVAAHVHDVVGVQLDAVDEVADGAGHVGIPVDLAPGRRQPGRRGGPAGDRVAGGDVVQRVAVEQIILDLHADEPGPADVGVGLLEQPRPRHAASCPGSRPSASGGSRRSRWSTPGPPPAAPARCGRRPHTGRQSSVPVSSCGNRIRVHGWVGSSPPRRAGGNGNRIAPATDRTAGADRVGAETGNHVTGEPQRVGHGTSVHEHHRQVSRHYGRGKLRYAFFPFECVCLRGWGRRTEGPSRPRSVSPDLERPGGGGAWSKPHTARVIATSAAIDSVDCRRPHAQRSPTGRRAAAAAAASSAGCGRTRRVPATISS